MEDLMLAQEERRILVVDDHSENRLIIKMILKSMGYENVEEAGDGLEALEKILEQKPSLVISDVMMPRMGGLLLCEALSKVKTWRDIDVIFQSSMTGSKNINRGIRAGAFGYIEKPVNARKLEDMIKQVFEDTDPILDASDNTDKAIFRAILHSTSRVLNMFSGAAFAILETKAFDMSLCDKEYDLGGQISANGTSHVIQLDFGWPKELLFHLYHISFGEQTSDLESSHDMIGEVLNQSLGCAIEDILKLIPTVLGFAEFSTGYSFDEMGEECQQFFFRCSLGDFEFDMMLGVGKAE